MVNLSQGTTDQEGCQHQPGGIYVGQSLHPADRPEILLVGWIFSCHSLFHSATTTHHVGQ